MKVPTLNDELRPWWGKLKVGLQYILFRSGPLSLSINHGGGFFKTNPSYAQPNMQLYFQAFSTLKPKVGERPILSPDPFSGMSIGLSNCRPTSRGTINIRSANPKEHPAITPNAFGTQHDIDEMLAAVKFIRRIAAQEPLKSLIIEELRPGPAIQSDADSSTISSREVARSIIPPAPVAWDRIPRHPCGTRACAFHGINGLRVCDASVFPNLIAGNTNAPSMMVGWKGADLILEDHR